MVFILCHTKKKKKSRSSCVCSGEAENERLEAVQPGEEVLGMKMESKQQESERLP